MYKSKAGDAKKAHTEGHQGAAQFLDKRSTHQAQLKLQKLMGDSPQVATQLATQATMANSAATRQSIIQREEKPNRTGMPDQLKTGIESLSGMSMDHVKVHYNSDKPAQLNAHAYAQGSDIHIAAGQEQHLPHEAWHIVQQAQGRVKSTVQLTGDTPVNTDMALESEADAMGHKAMQQSYGNTSKEQTSSTQQNHALHSAASTQVIQCYDGKLGVIHPITGSSVVMSLMDNNNGVYFYYHLDNTLAFSYNINTNQYSNAYGPISAAPDFNEDAGPIARSQGGQNTFRDLEFHTDGENRVIRAKGKIHRNGKVPESGRSSEAQSGAWDHTQGIHRRMFRPLKEFNGGHIVAHHFGGSPGTDNMVPMEKNYNQNGSYKKFENNLDKLLLKETPLNIDISVSYSTDYNDLMANLVNTDNANNVAKISDRPKLQDIVMRTLGRIPKAIQVNSLLNNARENIKPANPDSPMSTLKGTIPKNFSLKSIALGEFAKTGKGRDGDKSKKVFKPYEKSFGPKKHEKVDKRKHYHADYQTIYSNMPKPGITKYLPGINGLAGGVEAYIWIDPMGVFNRHGGSDTIDTVDPLGTQWNYFRKAKRTGDKNKIYKKGHLLNAHLHGPGADSRNLLPLTTFANGDMSRNFEEKVKKSEALINPAKGVLWKTETSGAAVTRPNDWDKKTAKQELSKRLFKEEAKIPQYLDCFAWEAIQHKGTIEKGRLLVQHRVWNKHPGDQDGVLGITRAGWEADDEGVHEKLPDNHNNVTGHDTVNPFGNHAIASENGYQLNYLWLLGNQGEAQHFYKGVYERGYDKGFEQNSDNQFNWPQDMISEYNKGYKNGERRLFYVRGFYTDNYQAPTNIDQKLNEQYDDGRYYRGKDIGKNLGPEPQAQSSDPIIKGYAEGLYTRGKEDANNDQPPAHQSQDYLKGYWKAYEDKAFDHGYDFTPIPDTAKLDINKYKNAYMKGQNSRGYDDGYKLEGSQSDQQQDYYLGHLDGLFDRGNDDAYSKQAPATTDEDYMKGYQQGADDLTFAEGYELEAPTYNIKQEPFSNSYIEGVEARGQDDGYAIKNLATNNNIYVNAYFRGLGERGDDDGENLRPRVSLHEKYSLNYNFALYLRGEKDAESGLMVPASQEPSYLEGFNS